MPFTAVPAALVPEGQDVLIGGIRVLAGTRIAFIEGLTDGLLEDMPSSSLFGNLFTEVAPGRTFKLERFIGSGLTITNHLTNGPFPEVVGEVVKAFPTSATSITIDLPVPLFRDRYILATQHNGANTVTTPTGWTLLSHVALADSDVNIYELIVEQAFVDANDYFVTVVSSIPGAALAKVWMVRYGHTSLLSEVANNAQTSAAGTTNDVGTLTPTWGLASNLWLTFIGLEADDPSPPHVSAYPSGFSSTGELQNVSATDSLDGAIAWGLLPGRLTSLDPSAYTHAASRSAAFLIAVPPRVTAAISASGGAGSQGWDDTLAIDAHSGANNPIVDDAQYMQFGIAAPPATGQIRTNEPWEARGDKRMKIRAGEEIELQCVDSSTWTVSSGSLGLTASGGIDIESTGLSVQLTAATNIDLVATQDITLVPSGDLLLGDGTLTDVVVVNSNGAVNINSVAASINLSAATVVSLAQGFLQFTEAAASTPSMAAGQGLFWVKNDTPNVPFFTDDANTDHQLAYLSAVTGRTWAQTLAAGAASGANDPTIDVGRFLNFGLTGPTTSNPQIRCGDATFRIRGGGNMFLLADGATGIAALATTANGSTAILQAQGTGSNAQVSGASQVIIDTGGVPRIAFQSAGGWSLAGDQGTLGEVITSQGAGAPPVWAAVDLSSVTYLAGDGIDLTGLTFSADVSDFAGSGLEDDGSNNLRIAAAAAGAGLTGGAGSALAVGAGTRITVNANDVQLAAGAAESFLMNATAGSAVADYRAGTSVAGAGLTYTAGGTLSVGAGTGIAAGADSISVDATWAEILVNGRESGAFNPQINTSQFIEFGSTGTLPATGGQIQSKLDFRIASRLNLDIAAGDGGIGAIVAQGNTVTLRDSLALSSFVVQGVSGIQATASSGSGTVTVNCGALQLLGLGGGGAATGGQLIMNEQDSSIASMSAARGMIWILSDAPCIPMFTGDTNVDVPLQQCYAPKTASTNVTNATTLVDLTGTYTVPANRLIAQSRFRAVAKFSFTRGATATALNILVNFRVGGSAITMTFTGVTTTNAAVQTFDVSAEFTVLTTGAGGTAMAAMAGYGATNVGANPLSAGVSNAALAVNTTGTLAVEIDAQMSANVASTTLRALGGHIEWIC